MSDFISGRDPIAPFLVKISSFVVVGSAIVGPLMIYMGMEAQQGDMIYDGFLVLMLGFVCLRIISELIMAIFKISEGIEQLNENLSVIKTLLKSDAIQVIPVKRTE